jgi:hypothetical protein
LFYPLLKLEYFFSPFETQYMKSLQAQLP